MSEIVQNILVDDKIFIIRGIQVMLDSDLAKLYEVPTKRLNEQVKRNIDKFPNDFMFQVSNAEQNELVAKCDRFKTLKHSSSSFYAFTEHGVYMLATVLKSKVATTVSLSIMRTFVRLKNQSVPYFDIIKRLETIELDNTKSKKLLDDVVRIVIDMQDIQDEAKENTRLIGFNR